MSTATDKNDTVYVDPTDLIYLDTRPSLQVYVKQIWDRRHFIWEDGRAGAYKQSMDYRLGRIWLILQPLLDGLLYGLIFGLLLQTHRGIDNFVGFLLIGITWFGFANRLFLMGNSLIKSSASLITSFSFPTASIVLSQTVRFMFDHFPPAIVSVIVALAMQWRTPISWSILSVIPLFLLIHFFGTGLMLITARVTAFLPDAKVGFDLISRFWFFSSGIFFSLDRFGGQGRVYDLLTSNPGYIFITAVRTSVLDGVGPSFQQWAILSAWSFGSFFLGLIFFWMAEDRYVTIPN